jgi:hypothetical protein
MSGGDLSSRLPLRRRLACTIAFNTTRSARQLSSTLGSLRPVSFAESIYANSSGTNKVVIISAG